MTSMISNNLRVADLFMGALSNVAPKRLRVLHIRPNLPEN
jgi:hypothetical protein